MQVKYISTLAIALLLLGCDAPPAKQVQQTTMSAQSSPPAKLTVEVDISTPDRAIKSYWSLRDQVRSNLFEYRKAQHPTVLRQQSVLEGVMTGLAYDHSTIIVGDLETFVRDIVEVKVESESRAMIIAIIKNSTPIPPGAELSKYEERSRKEGNKYKYVLEKSQAGWLVAEIWEFDTFRSSQGWNKLLPVDAKAFASSSTFNGN